MIKVIGINALISCLLFFISLPCLAAQWALVISDKAVIFSDIEMKSSIGFIRKGKKVRVGSVPKNKGRVLPLILNKKVLYIATKDIDVGVNLDKLGSASERIKQKMSSIQIVRNIGLVGGTYYGVLSSDKATDENALFLELGVRGYYTDYKKKENFRLTLSSSNASFENDINMNFFALSFASKMFGLQNYGQSFIFYLGGILIPYAEIKYQDLFKLTGYGVGAELGAEVRFNLYKNIHVHLDANYQTIGFYGMNLEENGTYDGNYNTYINGAKAMASLTISY